ncbi:MAG TPA: SIR2 family protein, partial [Candidatus Saccharimonadales bacterium]
MISLNEFASRIDPEKTVVLLGAGASIPSGAHSAVALTKTLAAKLGKSSTDLSLAEVCSIFEKSRGRKELAQAVAEEFQDLNPTGGLLLLPRFNWARLYGTNYDQLVEKAYRSHKRDIAVLNSNADFSKADAPGVVQYFKLHGDIQVDIGFGQQARMLLTERDYDEYAEFREAGFKTLEADMTSKDILIIGQSLADVHLRQLVNRVAKLHATKSLPGNIFLLTYKSDPDRASLFEDRGIIVSSGGINELMQGLIDVSPPNEEEKTEESGHTLPHA